MKYRQKENNQEKGGRNFHQKEKQRGRFNLDWNEDNVTYRTQIPQVPEKLKTKPDRANHQKKIKQVESKMQELKQRRKQKKRLYKQQTNSIDEDVEELRYKIELGEKCIKVLQQDRKQDERSIEDIEYKIIKNKRHIKDIQRQPSKQQKKEFEQMTYQQLLRQENKVISRMTLGNLSKKDEIEINSILNRISRFKVNAPRKQGKQTNDRGQNAIENIKATNQRLNKAQSAIKDRISDINIKIQSIEQDIQDFKEQKENLQASRKTLQQKSVLYQQAKAIKTRIYELREQRDKLEQVYQQRLHQYEYQQQRIKWINWASQIKQRKNNEWQEEKAKRKKEKLKFKQGSNENKQKDAQAPERKFERKVINRYQSQIDNCSFLINYCKDLYPDQTNQNKSKVLQPQNIDQVLKQGEWSKMKGFEVIVSKKKKEEDSNKKQSEIKKKKEQPKKEVTDKFQHTFFMEQAFEKVNVLPPSTKQQLEKTIKDLQQKKAYYVEHPEGRQSDRRMANDKYVPQKFTKMKAQQSKRGIAHEDFPSLF